MKKIINTIFIIIMILGALPLTAFGQEKADISEYLDKTISGMVTQKQVKGAIVSVVESGDIKLCKGFGIADEENSIATSHDNSAFHIGSISKTFVAVAAAQLVDSGKLDMKASIRDYLEADFPKFKYEITMHDLLTHTAGFDELLSGLVVFDKGNIEPLAISIRKYMPEQVFVPGEVVSYSNYGIALAAYVVERIARHNFNRYAEKNIFKPLNMTKTSFDIDYEGVTVSKAYGTNGKEIFEPLTNLYPEGSVISTATDMSKYMIWLLDDSNKVLSLTSKQEIFRQQFTMSDEFEGMGYTWSRMERNGEIYYVKKGITENFYSLIEIYPQQRTGVFISFNTDVTENKLDTMMDDITDLLLGQDKHQRVYTGKQSANVSGYYLSTRSNFTNSEKVLNFLTPNRVIRITGSISRGFSMNGKKLIPLGENYYSTPLGNLKYVDINGNIYLANRTSTSFVRTNWFESNGIQMLVFASFAIISLILAVIGIIGLFRRKAGLMKYFLASLSILNMALFIGMLILFFIGITNFNVLNILNSIRMFGIFITITCLGGIIYSIYLFGKKVPLAKKLLLITWNISSIFFCLWMVQVNIL